MPMTRSLTMHERPHPRCSNSLCGRMKRMRLFSLEQEDLSRQSLPTKRPTPPHGVAPYQRRCPSSGGRLGAI